MPLWWYTGKTDDCGGRSKIRSLLSDYNEQNGGGGRRSFTPDCTSKETIIVVKGGPQVLRPSIQQGRARRGAKEFEPLLH